MSKISTSDFQKGRYIIFRGEPYQITDFKFVNPGKGSAFVRSKLKHLDRGNVIEFTFKSGESVDELSIYTIEMQYLYKENENYVFMDNRTYEQYNLEKSKSGLKEGFIKEGDTYQILVLEGKAVGLKPPKKTRLLVTQAQDADKGNTVSGAKKEVEVETGAKVMAPLFIKTGDLITINPETGEYIEREKTA